MGELINKGINFRNPSSCRNIAASKRVTRTKNLSILSPPKVVEMIGY